jgi:LPXTG-motif cell wall-anchored protein
MSILSRMSKRILSSGLIVGIVFGQIGILPLKVSAATTTVGHTYYVSNDGNDGSAGTTPETAWKSLDKVNAQTFTAGDQILFRRGDKWDNKTLYPKGSGSDGNPIKIASYGDSQAALPAIAANAQVNDAVYLYNQQYWEISELDISNTSAGYTGERNATNGALLKDLRGIHITGKDVATLSGINLHNLYVHDVTGYDAWIGGLNDTNTTTWKEPGIIMNTGWDFSKRTGGILIEALKPSGSTPTIFKNITLADSTLEHNSFGAFTIKQWSGGSSGPQWAKRSTSATAPAYSDSNFKPHENITVRGNYIDQTGDYNANGIYVTSSKNVLVENNVVKNPGVCGIELYYVDNAVVQHNEVYGSRPKAGGADSNGIDPDREVTNTIIQYNYVHDNGDGILVCGFDYNSVIIRYNLLKDNTGIWFRDSVGKGLIEIYNNVCYNTLDRSYISFANSHGGGGSGEVWKYRNNIFYNVSNSLTAVSFGNDSSTNNIFDNNLYYGPGVSAPSRDKNAISADPMFTESAPIYGFGDSVANRVKDFSALKPKAGSPLINAGKPYVKNASAILINTNELDYEGKGLSATPEIGLFEAQFNGTLSGYVTNEYGEKVANAQVKLGDKETVNTNTNGYYVIPGIDMGTYSVTVSKDGYQSKTESVVVAAETDGLNLSIGEVINKNRDVNGIVTDSSGSAVEGAKVTISKDGSLVATAISETGGVYSLKSVPIGTGYTVTVSKDGYYDGLQLSVSILAEQSNGINVGLKAGVAKKPLISDDFNQHAVGSFTGNTLWGVYNSSTSNTIEIVNDPDDSNNKLLHLKRSTGSLSVYNKAEANISGVFTINTRVKRTTGWGQYGIYTYHKSGFNTTTPTSSTNPEATLAMAGGKILSHNVRGSSTTVTAADYTDNVWYNVTHVVDWGTGTYDLYVDGKLKLSNQPLRTWSNSIDLDYLQMFTTDGSGDFYVDYIDVYQGFPFNDKLSSIQVSNVEDLTVDGGNNTLYTGTVASTVDSVAVTANRGTDFPSRIFVNGEQVTTGEASQAIALQTGENTVSVDLKDGANNVLRSYTLKLTKEAPPVNKNELQALYDENKNKEQGNYTNESWTTFTTALNDAKVILDKADATLTEVDGAYEQLEAAVNGLVVKTVDKLQLETLYNANKDKAQGNYTDESWAAFTQALTKAQEVLADEVSSQEAINQALGKLQEGIDNLKEVPFTSLEDKDVIFNFAEGVLEKGTSFYATQLTSGEIFEKVKLILDGKITLYDFSLVKGDHKVQPNGEVEVSIPIPEGYNKENLVIYYISGDGSQKEKLTGEVRGNYYTFKTSHFSLYALVDESNNNNSDIGSNSNYTNQDNNGGQSNSIEKQQSLPQTGGTSLTEWLELSGLLIILGVVLLKKKSKLKA